MELINKGNSIRLESKRGSGMNLIEFHKIIRTEKGYHCGMDCRRLENKREMCINDNMVFDGRKKLGLRALNLEKMGLTVNNEKK